MDSLRALAAFSVLVYHLRAYTSLPYLVVYGNAGVTLFFLISAFLLYRPFVRARLRGQAHPELGPYTLRRFLRIVPGYWLALTVIAIALSERDVFGPHGLLYYGFGQIYQSETFFGGAPGAWTLCVEITLYAFLPLWAWLMRHIPARDQRAAMRNELVAVMLLIALSIVYTVALVDRPGFVRPWIAHSLPHYLDQFALGMALAILSVWFEDRPLPRLLRPLDRLPGVSWLLAAGALLATAEFTPTPHRLWASTPLAQEWFYGLIALLLILPCVFGDQRRGILRRVLGWRPVLWIGMVSYGVYLWHPLAIHYLKTWNVPDTVARALGLPSAVIWIPATLGLALLAAAVSWRLVEMPALRLAHQPREALRAAARRVAPATRAVVAGLGAALTVAGVAGVGYLMADLALILAGLGLVATAIRTSPALMSWSGTTSVLGTGAAVAAIVPILLSPKPAAGPRPAVQTTSLGAGQPSASSVAGQSRSARTSQLVLTFNGRRLALFVDGRLSASHPEPGAADAGGRTIEIGAYLGDNSWQGALADVSLYSGALPAQTISEHFRLGRIHGGAYDQAVRTTPGVVDYWRLSSPNRTSDSVGTAKGTASPRGIVGWYGIVPGSPGRATALDGLGAELKLTGVRSLRRTFSIEAWALPGPHFSNRTVLARPGAWFVKTDVLGQWTGGIFHRGRIESLSSRFAAVRPLSTAGSSSSSTVPPAIAPQIDPGRRGRDAAVSWIVLVAVAALLGASVPTLRRRRTASPQTY